MSAEIQQLHPIMPIGHYLRLGHTGHRQLDVLHASGRLGFDRVVVDAAHILEQKELIDSLRSSNVEIVLDTRVAELSTPGGHQSSARNLPWADRDRAFAVEDFDRNRISGMVARIADFAVEHRVDSVLGPTRLLDGPGDDWLAVDATTCEMLRHALDVRGANAVAIDYPLLTNYQVMLDGAARKALASHLADLPFEQLWLRIANFGSDKSAAGLRKYVNASRDFHELNKPVVTDGIGGLPALGVLAFGAVSGICHGVAEKERFYPHSWRRPRKPGEGGGSGKRVYFAGIDAYLSAEQARTLFATRNAKPLLGCRETGCCPGGWEDMISNPKTHYLNQTTRRMRSLSDVPDLRRADHFLAHQLAPADRAARAAVRLKVTEPKILEKLSSNSRKLDDMRHVFDELRVTDHNQSRARSSGKRAGRWSGPWTASGG